VFTCIVSEQSYGRNGFAALNELLCLNVPHVHGTRAPSFDTATSKKIVQGPSKTIPEYKRRFTLWLQSLRLYREFTRYQDSEVTIIWFIDGLLASCRAATTRLETQVAMIEGGTQPPSSAFSNIYGNTAPDIAALHRFPQGHGPGGGPSNSRGFTIKIPAPFGYSPCGGCHHPPNICCVCDAPTHRVNHCWHLLGLPTDRLLALSSVLRPAF
jgi:hypothetical protein